MSKSKQTDADKGPSLDGFLSAFGIYSPNPFLVPTNLKEKYEIDWARWINTKEGQLDVNAPKTITLSLAGFLRKMKKLGHLHLFNTPIKIGTKVISVDMLYRKVLDCGLFMPANHTHTVLKQSEIMQHFKILTTKLVATNSSLTVFFVLERRRQKPIEDLVLQLKGLMRFRVVPPALREILRPGGKAAKPVILTPKAEALCIPTSTVQSTWLKLYSSESHSIAVIRARQNRLVLKATIALDSRVKKCVTKIDIYRSWERIFSKFPKL